MTFCGRTALGGIILVCALMQMFPQFSSAQTNAPATASVESRRQQLLSLFDEQWQYTLRCNPEWATMLGDNRYNDRLSDESPEFFQSELDQERKFLARFEAIDPAGFSRQDTLSRELMIRELRQQIEGAQFKPWEMPVNQMNGMHLELPDIVALIPFNTVTDYDNYLARLRQIPHAFDQMTANMRQGLRDGLMPPRYLLEKVSAEADDVASKTGENSPFAKPVRKFPSSVPAADQKRLRDAVLAAVADQIIPAYQRFAAFVRNDYAPHGRTGIYMIQEGLRLLAPADQEPVARLDTARRVMKHLPETAWLRANRSVTDHLNGGDAGLYDLLLNPRDQAYTVPALHDLLAGAGLSIACLVEPIRYDPVPLLPDPRLRARIATLSTIERATLAEALAGNIAAHIVYCTRASEPPERADPFSPDAVPICREILGEELAKGIQANNTLFVGLDALRVPVPLPTMAGAILRLIDGKRSVGEIGDSLAARGASTEAFARAWRELFPALEGINRLLLAAPIEVSQQVLPPPTAA